MDPFSLLKGMMVKKVDRFSFLTGDVRNYSVLGEISRVSY